MLMLDASDVNIAGGQHALTKVTASAIDLMQIIGWGNYCANHYRGKSVM